MNNARCITSIALGALVFLAACDRKDDPAPAAGSATPTTKRSDAPKPAPAPDNTARNRGDGSADVKSPMDQSEASADIKTTADIRKSILDDKTMSINAQNCKIITDKMGMVTLRGVVNSQAEKDSVGLKAGAIAGAAKVDNQLEVKAN